MKKILLFVLIGFFSFQSFAQNPDPELFRVWHLHYLRFTDTGPQYVVSEINPLIHPYIKILEDFSFTGEGACNTFNGEYEFFGSSNVSAISYNNTTKDCDIQVHNSFEGAYFAFMQDDFYYNISQDSDGLTLSLGNFIFGHAIFKDYPLSTLDFTINDIVVFPNPVSDQLYISSENTIIETVSIYSLTGKKVIEELDTTNSIDVTTLSNGIYFIEISSVSGKSIKKFIKK